MQDNRQSQQVVPPSPYGAFNDQSQPSIDLLIRKLKSLEVQQRQKAEIRPSGDSLSRRDSINSPLKVGNINIFNMPKTLDKSKNTQHKVSQQNFEPMPQDDSSRANPEVAAPLTVLSRN